MNGTKLYPHTMQEAQQLGYEVSYFDCLLDNGDSHFTSGNEMVWEGDIGFDLNRMDDESDGNLGPIKVRARARFTFEVIEPD